MQAHQIALPRVERGLVRYIRMDMKAYSARLKAVAGPLVVEDGTSPWTHEPFEMMDL